MLPELLARSSGNTPTQKESSSGCLFIGDGRFFSCPIMAKRYVRASYGSMTVIASIMGCVFSGMKKVFQGFAFGWLGAMEGDTLSEGERIPSTRQRLFFSLGLAKASPSGNCKLILLFPNSPSILTTSHLP